jgi:MioC protein
MSQVPSQSAFSRLLILVGTMTGNAQYAAQAMAMQAEGRFADVTVQRMDGLDVSVFDRKDTLYLICTSTFGAGDVPDNAQALYASFDTAPRDLSHVRYGVFALGDSSYVQTFCGGGERFDAKLADFGAQRLGDIERHDAQSPQAAEDQASTWISTWHTSN